MMSAADAALAKQQAKKEAQIKKAEAASERKAEAARVKKEAAEAKVFGWGVYSHGSSRLPVAPIDSQQHLRLQTHAVRSLPMTPTDFHLLPPRELTPQPNSQGRGGAGEEGTLVGKFTPTAPNDSQQLLRLQTHAVVGFQ